MVLGGEIFLDSEWFWAVKFFWMVNGFGRLMVLGGYVFWAVKFESI